MFCGKHPKVFGIDPKVFGERVSRFLRAMFPSKTAVYVSDRTGYSVARVEKWLDGTVIPNGIAMLRLMCAFGPDFAKAVLADDCPDWIDTARLDAEHLRIEQTINDLRAQQEALRAP